MQKIHDSPADLAKVQGSRIIVKKVFEQEEKITDSQEFVLNQTITYLQEKLFMLQTAESVRRKRSPDYTSEDVIVDVAKDYWELKDKLETHQISLEELEKLITILEGLVDEEIPKSSELAYSYRILDKLADFILSQE